MPEIKLNLKPNLLRLFRYLSAIILNYLNEFRNRSNIKNETQKIQRKFSDTTNSTFLRAGKQALENFGITKKDKS
ncbi:putative conjugative transfer TraG domain protein [Orientia tsutsugamushi str. Kato PP]|uniref:Conjugal transfer protein TraG n=1 Tax=Orientia tsutsugamushi TaxID=784 RepID=A0A2U3RJ69_ORITS|nr:putative conjugative transfer TraG domain protein [Orientia tsutsugamushi str. Kato PP]SPR13275.1 conjugal transfer protein TraG [Orientia tsutsugamushi]